MIHVPPEGPDVQSINHIIPSGRMVIRRFMELEPRFIQNYFNKGPHFTHIPEFDDSYEGKLHNPGPYGSIRGGFAADSYRKRQREGEVEVVDEDEFEKQLKEFHQKGRHRYFASSWRIGTDESEKMWNNYADIKNGFAIETTVNSLIDALPHEPCDDDYDDDISTGGLVETDPKNIFVGSKDSDIRIGAVRYIDLEDEGDQQPPLDQASICFFKNSNYDFEREFRILLNPFDSSMMFESAADGTPEIDVPDVSKEWRFFPIDTTTMTKRIVLAPEATQDERNILEDTLDEVGVDYGDGDDVSIIESELSAPSRLDRGMYEAEFGGHNHYEMTEDQIENWQKEFQDKKIAQNRTIDLVSLSKEEKGAFVEGYCYPTWDTKIDLSSYGWGFQLVSSTRIQNHCNDKLLSKEEEDQDN